MTAEKIKHWQDPYEPTPEGFHLRVENTLRSLQKKENAAVPRIPVRRAVVLAALLLTLAGAAYAGSRLGVLDFLTTRIWNGPAAEDVQPGITQDFRAESESAVLHLDEKTPHIHATVVPITRGERRKAKLEREKNAQSGKRTYRTKKDRPRLCADDVMARDKLKAYQTTYAEAMAKYGLQRGVEGSEAKHISTQQYYREVFVRKNEMAEQIENLKEQQKTLTVDIAALQAQQRAAQTDCNIIDEQRRKKKEELEKAETELAQTRREIKTDKLKGVAVDATTKAVERIGALFHDPKPARYEKQIADLQGVIADKDKCIGQLQQEIKTMQAGHDKEVANLKQEAQQVIKALMRVDELCPYVKGLLKWENYCKDVGLDKERTKALFTMQPYRYTGELHSIRYNHTFRANDVILQFKPDKDGPSGFQFTINGKDCDEWFRQQRKEFYERIGIDIEQTEQRRGMKM